QSAPAKSGSRVVRIQKATLTVWKECRVLLFEQLLNQQLESARVAPRATTSHFDSSHNAQLRTGGEVSAPKIKTAALLHQYAHSVVQSIAGVPTPARGV